jgi:hypothetical protein
MTNRKQRRKSLRDQKKRSKKNSSDESTIVGLIYLNEEMMNDIGVPKAINGSFIDTDFGSDIRIFSSDYDLMIRNGEEFSRAIVTLIHTNDPTEIKENKLIDLLHEGFSILINKCGSSINKHLCLETQFIPVQCNTIECEFDSFDDLDEYLIQGSKTFYEIINSRVPSTFNEVKIAG